VTLCLASGAGARIRGLGLRAVQGRTGGHGRVGRGRAVRSRPDAAHRAAFGAAGIVA